MAAAKKCLCMVVVIMLYDSLRALLSFPSLSLSLSERESVRNFFIIFLQIVIVISLRKLRVQVKDYRAIVCYLYPGSSGSSKRRKEKERG